MAAPQSDAFKKAIEDSKKLTSKPGPDELLQLYGNRHLTPPRHVPIPANMLSSRTALYKVGTGEDFSKAGGKAKHKAWEKVVNEGVTPEAAQEQYVKLVEELKEKYGYDENKVPEAVGGN
ncbi:ACB domain-containing protein [Fusarium falciforme]|uniref:ACB domain-containing protein n=1 Tax=Fusarium falciforme TaxID=195108 RepID=UPI00230172D6|nr:ACB domain-containing protein [Fusarium falciforme]WAO85321.1 ACB domain-containing protein [Fusarium falciforme]